MGVEWAWTCVGRVGVECECAGAPYGARALCGGVCGAPYGPCACTGALCGGVRSAAYCACAYAAADADADALCVGVEYDGALCGGVCGAAAGMGLTPRS